MFVLDTSSIPVIEKLVARRYLDLSQVDAQTIAEFSGGNARVALALASQIEKTETVAGLSEEELFKRLFQQRHDPDPSLLWIAQACSLVYSFEGELSRGMMPSFPFLAVSSARRRMKSMPESLSLSGAISCKRARNGARCCRTPSPIAWPEWHFRTFRPQE